MIFLWCYLLKKAHFFVSVFLLGFFLFYIVFQAAILAQCHRRMARENGKYLKSCFRSCFQLFGRKKNDQLYSRKSLSVVLMLLKAEGLPAPKLFYQYAFTWGGNYQITIKTIYLVRFVEFLKLCHAI